VLEDKERLAEFITPSRTELWEEIKGEFEQMKSLTESPRSRCWAKAFNEVYSYTYSQCGGCPKCRKENSIPFNADRSCMIFGGNNFLTESNTLNGKLYTYLGLNREVLLYPFNSSVLCDQSQIFSLCRRLVASGVRNIVISKVDYSNLGHELEQMPYENCVSYSLFEAGEFVLGSEGLSNGPVALIYPLEGDEPDQLYKWSQDYLHKSESNQVIHIAPKNLLIPSQNKLLYELVEGLTLNADAVLVEAVEMIDWI